MVHNMHMYAEAVHIRPNLPQSQPFEGNVPVRANPVYVSRLEELGDLAIKVEKRFGLRECKTCDRRSNTSRQDEKERILKKSGEKQVLPDICPECGRSYVCNHGTDFFIKNLKELFSKNYGRKVDIRL